MKISFSKLIFNRTNMSILCACAMFGAQGFDLPVFYRAPFFQTEATQKIKDWTSVISVRVGYGLTSDSFDNDEERTGLFNAQGPFDLTRLGLNVEGITQPTITKPKTAAYWEAGRPFAKPNPTQADPTTFAYPNGRVQFDGDFSTIEGDLTLKQNLCWGFYAHLYVPYKQLKIENITTTILGTPSVNGVDMNDFIKNKLPGILDENGLETATDKKGKKILATSFEDTGFGDVALSVGWQGYIKKLCGFLTSFGGLVQAGVVIPVAEKQDPDAIFSLPLGYNEHTGIVSRLAVEAGIWDTFVLGVQAGSLIFFKNDRDIYLKTDKGQTGWIFLQKAHVKEDLGSIWDVAGYAKMNIAVKGLDILVGYSFTRQEATTLQVEDDNYLKTAREKIITQLTNNNSNNPVHIGTDGPNIMFISQDDFANSDARLSGWETQTVHFLARYDMSAAVKGCWGPLFQIEYNYPVWGKRSWATDVIAGTLGFTISLNF